MLIFRHPAGAHRQGVAGAHQSHKRLRTCAAAGGSKVLTRRRPVATFAASLIAAVSITLLAAGAARAQSPYGQGEYDAPGRRAPPAGQWRDGAPALDGQQNGYWSGDAYQRRPGRPAGRGQQLDDSADYTPSHSDGALEQAIDPRFHRQNVRYEGRHAPGSVVIDTRNKYLYLVQPGGVAIRYGIGVGREGFQWKGRQSVAMKREWPDWRPPAEMRKRRPDLPRFMAGGPENPLGARALYLGSTLYRIHGTNEPNTIGQNVSSGCIRLTNDDVIDLYSRVNVGAPVVVL